MRRVLLLVIVLGSLAMGIVCLAKDVNDPKLPGPLNRLISKLRSQFLKEACLKLYPALRGMDAAEANKAVDLFCDLRASEVLMDALEGKSPVIRQYAMKAIRDLAQPGDKEIAKRVIREMDRLIGLGHSGGSETQIAFDEFMKAMVETLAKITELDMEGVSIKSAPSLRAFVAKAKEWLAKEEQKVRANKRD